MIRFFAFAFAASFCFPLAAVEKPSADQGEKPVTIYVGDHRGAKVIVLPPEIDFEIDGKYLYNMEMLEDQTRIGLQQTSVEIYVSKERSDPKKITVQAFQVGPGFYIPPDWKVVKGWPPRKDK